MGIVFEGGFNGKWVKLVTKKGDMTGFRGGGYGGWESVVIWLMGRVDFGEEFEGFGELVCFCKVCEFVVEFEDLLVWNCVGPYSLGE